MIFHCLSVRQPWAWLLVHGPKDVENRTWETRYRGPLLIHASKTPEAEDWRWLVDKGHKILPLDDLPRGAIIGAMNLVDCSKTCRSDWHNPGCWGWYVASPRVLPAPIPYRGQQGIFPVPATVLAGKGFAAATPEG